MRLGSLEFLGEIPMAQGGGRLGQEWAWMAGTASVWSAYQAS